jgi:serine phosphatase RsbU (regulator of sigma subunit)
LGVFLVIFLARRMSLAVMVSQQKTRELDQLEQLGRAIITAPADAARLPALLEKYLPTMLSYQQLSVWLFDGSSLVNLPQDRPVIDERILSYFQDCPKPLEIFPGEAHPWSQQASQDRFVIMPILSSDTQVPIGGICLVQEVYIFADVSIDVKPALQVLAAQIASALHAAEVFTETLEHQKIAQEMAFAGKIQASFLPHAIPDIEGWRISAALEPARETSGDFFDLIQLPGNRLGIVIADVTDKGMGAALFMALSRTLIRTYAIEYPRDTSRVMVAANQRIISDASAGLFVTAFYGVLDTTTGELIFTNAGHNPPYHIRPGMEVPAASLKGTGMALGLMEDAVWEQGTVLLELGDNVVLYSDGITEANNPNGSFYGDDRLVAISLANADRSVEEMQGQILSDLRLFVDAAPQSDDITLLVLKRV